MRLRDRSMIKALEVHTIMASSGFVVMGDVMRVISVSPNHASMLGLPADGTGGVFGGRFFIVAGNGYVSPYWKARKEVVFGVDDGVLVVRTDHGVGIMMPARHFPVLPQPPESVRTVDLHRKKVWLSGVLGTRNYKRPRPSKKYVALEEVFPRLGVGGLVKSSSLLQVLEVAWRVNRTGKVGVRGDELYVLASGRGYGYEAFIQLV